MQVYIIYSLRTITQKLSGKKIRKVSLNLTNFDWKENKIGFTPKPFLVCVSVTACVSGSMIYTEIYNICLWLRFDAYVC